MNKTVLTFLIGGAVVVFLMVAALVAFVMLPFLTQAMAPEPQGPILVYEVDPDALKPGRAVDMEVLTKAINGRLNLRWNTLARVRQLDDRRIEVALMKADEAAKERVENLLARAGTLEFRILANNRDNKNLIERALADPSKRKLLDASGKLEAWWVPVKAEDVATGISGCRDIALRKRTDGKTEIAEVLLVPDDYNVTGDYLKRADVNTDRRGQPCVQFTFNNAGGQLFGQLTGSHLPDELTDFAYKLGIIVDDELYSAPTIRSTIVDSGEITGSFTKEQVEDLVRVLNAGSLPAKIRPVKK